MAILINSESWQIASFGECWRTSIAYYCTFGINIEVPKMGVTVEEHIGMARWFMVGIIDMTMGEPNACTIVNKKHRILEHRELK